MTLLRVLIAYVRFTMVATAIRLLAIVAVGSLVLAALLVIWLVATNGLF